MPSRWRTRITPICDQPRAAPPPRARPIFSLERGSRSAAIWVTPSPPPPSPSPNARRAIPSHNMTLTSLPVAIVAHGDESLMNERQTAVFRCLPRAGNVALVNGSAVNAPARGRGSRPARPLRRVPPCGVRSLPWRAAPRARAGAARSGASRACAPRVDREDLRVLVEAGRPRSAPATLGKPAGPLAAQHRDDEKVRELPHQVVDVGKALAGAEPELGRLPVVFAAAAVVRHRSRGPSGPRHGRQDDRGVRGAQRTRSILICGPFCPAHGVLRPPQGRDRDADVQARQPPARSGAL